MSMVNAPIVEASDLVEIDCRKCSPSLSFRLLQDLVVPRPVYLLSTISEQGVCNVAPYSYVMPAATSPAIFAITFLNKDDGSEKDTLLNLRVTGDLVINLVTHGMVQAANACGAALQPDISEFTATGLEPAFHTSRAPHVAQSPVRLECRYEREFPAGDGGAGAGTIVTVLVHRAYVLKAAYRKQGGVDVEPLRLIGRIGMDRYLIADDFFNVARPDTGETAA
jgi:flavin reductase (DIM6/NTAB) family NADH-FMN oxidoreductase RutF